MRILPGVAIKSDENSDRLRGQGSPVKFIYWGLVDPNCSLKKNCGKGNPVNIQEPIDSCLTSTETFWDILNMIVVMSKH